MTNIDDFNLGSGLILARLYAAFPVPQVLKVAELASVDDCLPEERAARLLQRRRIFTATVQFLAEEGFIVYQNSVGLPDNGAFSQVRLTARGLAQLSKTPEAIKPPGQTLGARLVAWAEKAGEAASMDGVRALVAALLG